MRVYQWIVTKFGWLDRYLLAVMRRDNRTAPAPKPWPDLWWDILDHDPLMQQIHQAADQAGLCRDCAKSSFHDDPAQECECLGGGRAAARLMRKINQLYLQPPPAETEQRLGTPVIRKSDHITSVEQAPGAGGSGGSCSPFAYYVKAKPLPKLLPRPEGERTDPIFTLERFCPEGGEHESDS